MKRTGSESAVRLFERLFVRLISPALWLSICLCLGGAFRMSAAAEKAYGYLLPLSQSTYLTEADIEDMPPKVLCFARYEIYARYGVTFYSNEVQTYFNMQYWYTPAYETGTFTEDMLNSYEQANIDLLLSREEQLGSYEPDGSYDYSEIYDYISAQQTGAGVYDVDPDTYIFYDSDKRLLTYEEACDLSLQELCYARNEIYARHGRLFVSSELQNYFDQKNWYYGSTPPDEFSDECLNETELTNAELLHDIEYSRSDSGYELDLPDYSYKMIGCYRGGSFESRSDIADDEYIFRYSNTRYLTQEEISALPLQMLCYARNEIYARRGYIFRSQELRDYFGSKSWYYGTIPAAQFSASVFNEWESANIELLQKAEYSINPDGYELY